MTATTHGGPDQESWGGGGGGGGGGGIGVVLNVSSYQQYNILSIYLQYIVNIIWLLQVPMGLVLSVDHLHRDLFL